jgi:magnesium chelatase subunit I
MALNFPFTAIVAQDEMKLAIALSTIEPSIGGVLIFGDRGTGKVNYDSLIGGALATHEGSYGLPLPLRSQCPDLVFCL